MVSWLFIFLVGWGLYVSVCFLKGYLVFYVVMKRQKKVVVRYSLNIGSFEGNSIVRIFTILARVIDTIFKVLLPNWLVSDYFKECIKTSFQDIGDERGGKNQRREFIKTMNYSNLLISIICIVLFAISGIIADYRFDCLFSLVLFILCLRAISRSYEIIKAFLNDVLKPSDKKCSSLNCYERLGLALTSLFEVGINYGFIYYSCLGTLELALKKSVGNTLLVDVNEINIVTLLQVLTSMTLIYLALANYIGSKDEKTVEIEESKKHEDGTENEKNLTSSERFLYLIIIGILVFIVALFTFFTIHFHNHNFISTLCKCEDKKVQDINIEIDMDMDISQDSTNSYQPSINVDTDYHLELGE